VGWYGAITDAEVRRLVRNALNISDEDEVWATLDTTGASVALNAAIPTGTKLDVRHRPTRFGHAQAHLANERTLLAWVRTSLKSLSVAFALLQLVATAPTAWTALALYVVASAFVLSVFTTFLTGWLRFSRVRDVLLSSSSGSGHHGGGGAPLRFHRLGLSHQAYFLAALCALLTAVFFLAHVPGLQA